MQGVCIAYNLVGLEKNQRIFKVQLEKHQVS